MSNDIIVVTGANSGIGKETARALAAKGATTVLACRDLRKAAAAAGDLRDTTGNEKVTTVRIDLADLNSVDQACVELIDRFGRVDVLVNNAGGIWSTPQMTPDGLEYTFQVNYLAHYFLTRHLLSASSAAWPRRIVNVTSVGHRQVRRPCWHNPQTERRHGPLTAYYQSKLAQVLFTRELARRFGPSGIIAHCCHPGTARTRFGKDGDVSATLAPLVAATVAAGITPTRAAATSVFLATSPEAEHSNGGYWVRRAQRKPSRVARDPDAARNLWELSERLLATAGHPA